jgi:hypothetical protein
VSALTTEWPVAPEATAETLYRFARAAIQDARGWLESKRPDLLRITELLCEANHYRALARMKRTQ